MSPTCSSKLAIENVNEAKDQYVQLQYYDIKKYGTSKHVVNFISMS